MSGRSASIAMPDREERDGGREHDPATDPLGEQTATDRTRDGPERVDEEVDADAGVGLVERGLDLADERRDEESGPADQPEPEAGEDGRRFDPAGCGGGHPVMLAAARGVYGRGMAAPTPSGILFFVHGANETSVGHAATIARIEDQVRARGWDVTVVAPEWRRTSDLRLGNWKAAVHRRGRPSPMPMPILRAGLRRDAVMKIVTNYFEDRREALFDVIGPQMLADVIGYHAHRASIQAVLRRELEGAARAARGRPVLPVAASLGGIALVDLLASWPEAPVEACVTVGTQAPLLYTFDAIPALPYDEADPPHLRCAVAQHLRHPRLPVVPRRAAVPPERRSRERGRPAGAVGEGLPEIAQRLLGSGAGLGCHRDGVHLETDRAADRARGAPPRLRGAQGTGAVGQAAARETMCAGWARTVPPLVRPRTETPD